MIQSPKILVIVGSVRAGRVCPQIAEWVAEVGRDLLETPLELVDLKDWPLPMDDDPGIPAAHPHTSASRIAWGRKVAEGVGFVFVTPQYNWGYPASLKNALDQLYKEWTDKPAMIVTYGSRGGGQCAAQLRQVLQGLRMRQTQTSPGLKLPLERMSKGGGIEPQTDFADCTPELRQAFDELAAALADA